MPVFTQKLLHYTHILRDEDGEDHPVPMISARVGEFMDDWRSGECSVGFPASSLEPKDIEVAALRAYADKQAAIKQARDDAKAAKLLPPLPPLSIDDRIAQVQAVLDDLLAAKAGG